MRLYLDSNIFISWIKGEFGRKFEFMENSVARFLDWCGRERHTLLLSDLFFYEVKKITGINAEGVFERLKEFEVPIEIVETTMHDKENADGLERKRGVHKMDARHATLAMKSNAYYIITWNRKDFENVEDKVRIASPNDFTF